MNRMTTSLASFGAGAALAYFLDPQHGKRRRADATNRAVRLANETNRALDVATRDLENRARGVVAEAKGIFTKDSPTDETIVQRARARLGRVCSHPSLIETSCEDGVLILEGPVLAKEHTRLLEAMSKVKGVRGVESYLESYDQIPAEHGGPQPIRRRAQRRWTPSTKLLASVGGASLCVFGLRRGGVIGSTAAVGGGMLLVRAISDMKLRQLVGLGDARRAITLDKTIEVHAPPEEVFPWFANPETFPRFMSNVEEVTRKSDGQYHWKVAGPAGTTFEWDAKITEMEPGKVLAWNTAPGSTVGHAGVIRCDSNASNGTRLTIRMSYLPPAGALGHAFAKLFGADPKTQLDEDMVRFKSLIEEGKATARGKTVHREELHIEPMQTVEEAPAEEAAIEEGNSQREDEGMLPLH